MKKPALRQNRMKRHKWTETEWTKSSKSLGEYIFRRLSLDQSDKNLNRIRPRHNLSHLIVQSKEIDSYVADYLSLQESKRNNFAGQNVAKVRKKNIVIVPSYMPRS